MEEPKYAYVEDNGVRLYYPVNNPWFREFWGLDDPKPEHPTESYRIIIIDFSKEDLTKKIK